MVGCAALLAAGVSAQEPAAVSKGTVVIQSRPDEAVAETQASSAAVPEITDAERAALSVTAYDLDTRLTPATSRIETRARVTVRNDGAMPLKYVALQVSSSLTWESVTIAGQKAAFSQHKIDTDADHTGAASELVVTQALAPGATVEVDTFYAGTIEASSVRLTRLGASSSAANDTDWDQISTASTALRGFGNVLWYPVAAPQLFLGQGADLFDAVNVARLKNQAATIALRISVAYQGDSLDAVYFDGRRATLKAIADDPNAPISVASGIATATFAAEPIGFRVPSLFLIDVQEKMGAPVPNAAAKVVVGSGVSTSNGDVPAFIPNSALLAIASDDDKANSALAASAEKIAPMLQVWFGAEPLSALTVIDHAGQPFEDGPLLVAPVAALGGPDAAQALAHSLTHAFVQTGQPWIDEGLAQFSALLWTENQLGRDAAVAQLMDLVQPLGIVEPGLTKETMNDSAAVGQPLIAASSEMFYRRKAAAVWFMLRNIVGDEALAEALTTFRQRTPKPEDTPESVALAFEHVIEHAGRKNSQNPIDLRWFFRDWVLQDRGLPDLTIVDVVPRTVAPSQGRTGGFLVAVNVRNDGSADVQVPVTIHTLGGNTLQSQLRVPAFAVGTARMLTETAPTDVQVNDGTTPELRSSIHKLTVDSTTTK